MRRCALLLCVGAVALAAACASAPGRPSMPEAPVVGWKGNLHAHSLWSDGTDFPEMIVAWYREHGYHFLSLTEHDRLMRDERWVDVNAPDEGWPPRNASARNALPAYHERFGTDWVQEREIGAGHLVRLRTLDELRARFEEPGRFRLLQGEEITDAAGAHVNAINLTRAIAPQGGESALARIRANVLAVRAQQQATGRPLLAIANHPNYTWAWTAEDIARIPEAVLFEVYNGHALVNNEGDSLHVSTERLWDVALTLRHEMGFPPLYAVATDDAHDYGAEADTISRPGRGWIMVRTQHLTDGEIVAAVNEGRFYASTGVSVESEERDAEGIRIRIAAEPDVTYRTQFIGTLAAVPLESTPVTDAGGETVRTTRTYDDGVGAVLAEVEGPVATYAWRGDERYVRVRIISSKPHVDPTTGRILGVQKAWLQPAFR